MPNSSILLNVVTVVYNGEKTIEKTIKSVLEQTYDHIKYYVVDGQSTDNTLTIIKKYESQIERWISEKDRGIYDAMNKAIKLIEDENSYIIFLNSDDYFYDKDVIKNAVSKFANHDFIYGKVYYRDLVSEFGTSLGKREDYYTLPLGMIQHQATFTKKALFTKYGYFDLTFRIASDYDFALKIFSNDVKTQFIDNIISTMAMGGISSSLALKTFEEKIISLKRYYKGPLLIKSILKIRFIERPRYFFSLVFKQFHIMQYWRSLKKFFYKL